MKKIIILLTFVVINICAIAQVEPDALLPEPTDEMIEKTFSYDFSYSRIGEIGKNEIKSGDIKFTNEFVEISDGKNFIISDFTWGKNNHVHIITVDNIIIDIYLEIDDEFDRLVIIDDDIEKFYFRY